MPISEVIRFLLPAAKRPLFSRLREQIATHGGVHGQYFGYILPGFGIPVHSLENHMCWIINWSGVSDLEKVMWFRSQLSDLAEKTEASLFFEFKPFHMYQLCRALEAPICQFAIINLKPNAPLLDHRLHHSMHKTFTDCYYAPGFVGGGWEVAVNTNQSDGVRLDASKLVHQVGPENRRLACYYLGWESIEHHDTYAATELFAEEIDKLAPWYGEGTGSWYATLEKHT